MQTLLAFALSGEPPPDRETAGLARVERWYAALWGEEAARSRATTGRLGVVLWDGYPDECRWPSWAQAAGESVATVQVPLGYEQLVDAPVGAAPLALARRLRERPRDVLQLTAPFALAHLDQDRRSLTLTTDALGIGRLFEVHTPEGRFWSNRPVAALLFAGVPAEADPLAWARMAACDWPMGDRTPYRGVRAVPAATQIVVDDSGPRRSSLNLLAELTTAARAPDSSVADTAAALVRTARFVAGLWPQVPTLGLSGGRDSRLVVAAFVAAGVDVSLRTYASAPGEEETARRLVARLRRPLPHQVGPADTRRSRPGGLGAYARARQWHDVAEGLRPALYLRGQPPTHLLRQRPALVCGVGGEFGHAPGYPDDVERLERLPSGRRQQAYQNSLQAKLVLPRGLAPHSVSAVGDQIGQVLDHARGCGVTDAKALDWFYADERLRRWGLSGESFGRVLPLLVPEFVSAAFGLSTAQSLRSSLHVALIAHLVPAWSDVDFYSATLKERHAVPRRRLWQEDDVAVLTSVLGDATAWGDAFDVHQVQAIWRQALAGRATARDELLLQRVVWRAAFQDHLAAVNGTCAGHRAPAADHTPRPARDPLRPLRALALHANDVPLARRAARTPLGRAVRRRLGV